MLRRLFTPASDSLILFCSGGRKARWRMLWNLIWVPWLFGDVLAGIRVSRDWWAITSATLVVFLVLYACVNVRPAREWTRYALAMAALALLVMPESQFASGTLLIYACAYLSLQPKLARLLVRIVPTMLAWLLETWLLHWPWQSAAWVAVVALAVSVGQHSYWSRVRGNAELRLTHDEIRRLAATAERERIGRDLHDLLGHTLSLVALKSELAGRLIQRDPRAARREIADVEHVAREALAQVRSAVSGIRAAALVSELASAHLLLETAGVHMEYRREAEDLPAEVETCLALTLREAVTNIERHARAAKVEVVVRRDGDRVHMRVADDGRGGVDRHGNGLAGMRERIAALGGDLAIGSPRGQGTAIEVALPLPAPEGPAPRSGAVQVPAALLAGGAGSHA